MNRVLILGKTTEDRYIEAILAYTDPDKLECFTTQTSICEDMDKACSKLHSDVKIVDQDVERYGFRQFLCFCDDVGIEAVSLLEEAIKNDIDVIFVKALKKE